MTKLLIIIGIILIIIAGVFFYQNRSEVNLGFNNSEPKSTVKIKDKIFNVDLATSSAELQKGLSGRNSLPEDLGMLFIFDNKDFHTFWMKDMEFPIDIIFINEDKIISIIKNIQPPKTTNEDLPLYKPTSQVDKVLEINAGLADKYEIKNGDKVEIKLNK